MAVKLLRAEYGSDPDFLARFRAGGAGRGAAEPPEHRRRLRLRRGPVGPVHRHGAGRRRGPRQRPAPERAAAAAPGRARRAAGRHAPRRGARPRASSIATSSPATCSSAATGGSRSPTSASPRRSTEAQLTMPGMTMGSVHYFSPEQARGETATAASDIYSLGHRAVRDARPAPRPFTGDAPARSRWPGSPPRRRRRRPSAPACRPRWTRSCARRWRSTPRPATRPPPRWPPRSRAGSRILPPRPPRVRRASPARPRPPAGRAGRRGRAAGAGAAGAVRRGTVAAAAARRNAVPYSADAYARSAPVPAPVSTHGAAAAAADRRATTARRGRRQPARGPGSPACSGSLILVIVGVPRVPDAHRRRRRPPRPSASPRRRRRSSSRSSSTMLFTDAETAGRGARPHGRPRPATEERPTSSRTRSCRRTRPRATLVAGRQRDQRRRSPAGGRPSPCPTSATLTEAAALQAIVAAGLTVGHPHRRRSTRRSRSAASSASSRGPGIIVAPGHAGRLRASPNGPSRRRRRRPPRRPRRRPTPTPRRRRPRRPRRRPR